MIDTGYGDWPLLGLLVDYLQALSFMRFERVRKVVYHLIDAFSALYDREELMLKSIIISEFTER